MIEDEMRELRERIEGIEACLRAVERMVVENATLVGVHMGIRTERLRADLRKELRDMKHEEFDRRPGWWSRGTSARPTQ